MLSCQSLVAFFARRVWILDKYSDKVAKLAALLLSTEVALMSMYKLLSHSATELLDLCPTSSDLDWHGANLTLILGMQPQKFKVQQRNTSWDMF